MNDIKPTIQFINEMVITGYQAITKNNDESKEDSAKIPGLWRQFLTSKLCKNNSDLYGVYSNYESDVSGIYTATVGTISGADSQGYDTVIIPAGKYLVFNNRGTMPQTVIDTWHFIWAFFSSNDQYERTYQSDFEHYISEDKVAIHIGIK